MNRTLETLTESQLIEQAQGGDRFAFDELVNLYQPRMLRTALRILRNMDDAEDAVQQAFVSAWKNLDKFRGDASFSTWITRITLNEALTSMRRRKHQFVELKEASADQAETIGPLHVSGGEDPEQRILRRERERLLHGSLQSVKPGYRAAMQLRLLEDLSLEEISRRLRIPVNTVKIHLYRGRQAMKSFLQQKMSMPTTA